MTSSLLPSLSEACQLIHELHERGHSLLDIELAFRRNDVPIFIFGETLNDSTLEIQGCEISENRPYFLRVSVRRSFEHALLDVENGCRDQKENHRRLKDCGVLMTMSTDQDLAEKELKRISEYGQFGGKMEYAEPHYSAIMEAIKRDDKARQILDEKRFKIGRLTWKSTTQWTRRN
jgi:hypothetical protein